MSRGLTGMKGSGRELVGFREKLRVQKYLFVVKEIEFVILHVIQ
jgi:hypothetical protein